MDVQGHSPPATEGEAAPLCIVSITTEDATSLFLNNYFISFESEVLQIRRRLTNLFTSSWNAVLFEILHYVHIFPV